MYFHVVFFLYFLVEFIVCYILFIVYFLVICTLNLSVAFFIGRDFTNGRFFLKIIDLFLQFKYVKSIC